MRQQLQPHETRAIKESEAQADRDSAARKQSLEATSNSSGDGMRAVVTPRKVQHAHQTWTPKQTPTRRLEPILEHPTQAEAAKDSNGHASRVHEPNYGASKAAREAEEPATTAGEQNEPNTGAEQSAPSAAVATTAAEQAIAADDQDGTKGSERYPSLQVDQEEADDFDPLAMMGGMGAETFGEVTLTPTVRSAAKPTQSAHQNRERWCDGNDDD